MPFPTTIIERYGSLSATGLAKESSFGVPVAATTFLPMSDNSMEEDPGWFSPDLMQGVRDKQVYNLYGEAKYAGAVMGPLFPSNAMQLLSASIGADAAVGWGVASPAATPTSTTSTAPTIAGATSITLTVATGFAAGQQIVVDSGSVQEFREIASVAGSIITVADGFTYAHASGVAATTGTTTTLSAGSAANATTVTVTSAAGLAIGNIIQIDVNSVSGATTSEIRKITNIVSTTLTLDVALVYAHANAEQVTIVAAPFTHTFIQQNSLPSLTVEKNIGGYQSLQFAGCRVNKWELKAPVGNTAPEITADLMGQSVAVLTTPTGISIANEAPYVFAEASVTLASSARADASNVTVTVENGIKETYTYSGQHGPSFLTPVQLHAAGAIDVVFYSLNDTTYGDFTRMANGTLGALQFSLTHPASAGSVTLNMPQVALSKFANPLKSGDVVMSTLTYEASRPLSGVSQYTVNAVVVNNTYTAY